MTPQPLACAEQFAIFSTVTSREIASPASEDGGHLKGRAFNCVLFAGLAVWTGFSHPWVTPAFVALAAGQAMLVVFWLRVRAKRFSFRFVIAFVSLSYVGLAYLVAIVIGHPDAARFWIIFGAASAVFAPVSLLARSLLRRRMTSTHG